METCQQICCKYYYGYILFFTLLSYFLFFLEYGDIILIVPINILGPHLYFIISRKKKLNSELI